MNCPNDRPFFKLPKVLTGKYKGDVLPPPPIDKRKFSETQEGKKFCMEMAVKAMAIKCEKGVEIIDDEKALRNMYNAVKEVIDNG